MYCMHDYGTDLDRVLACGVRVKNRTGVDSIRMLGLQSRYMIANNFPLLTMRKMWPKSIFAELKWVLSGLTDTESLEEMGCNYWSRWTDPELEENRTWRRGFEARYGIKLPGSELGPVYGFQLRHFGGDYLGWVRNQSWALEGLDPGVDQLTGLISGLVSEPRSRRHVVSYWNPGQISMMRLPPCHHSFEVDVDSDGYMTLIVNQRSADFPVGVPANVAFYAAMCYILAAATKCKPYLLIHNTRDAHIYENQIDGVREYLSRGRDIVNSPRLLLSRGTEIIVPFPVPTGPGSVWCFGGLNLEIVDYAPLGPISIPVIV